MIIEGVLLSHKAVSQVERIQAIKDNIIKNPARRPRLESLLALLVIVGALLILAHHITLGELSLNGDEGAHANTSMYFARLFHDMPVHDPVQYTYQYYAHSPSFGLIHWPPLAYVMLGCLLYVWPSLLTVKLGILAFSALAFFFQFKLARYFLPFPLALLSIPLLSFMPGLLVYEKAVMLEVPCLAFTVMAVYLWVRFLDSPSLRNGIYFAVALAATILAKYNAVYLPLFCFCLLFAWRKARLLLAANTWIAAGVTAILIAPYYALVWHLNGNMVAKDLTQAQTSTAAMFLIYINAIPHQVGYVMLVLAVAGAVVLVRDDRRLFWLAICWIASVYSVMVSIGHKEERYVIYWVPAFALLAVSLFRPVTRNWLRRGQAVAAGLVLTLLTLQAWSYQRPYVAGYAEVARDLLQRTRSGFVLVDDDDNCANLIFLLNVSDPSQKIYILRKALYVAEWNKRMGVRELVSSPDDIAAALDRYGVRYIVVHDGEAPLMKSQLILRSYLKSGRFRLIERIPLQSNPPNSGQSVLMYENLEVHPIETKFVTVPMMTIARDIVVPVESTR